jgi:dihydroorotate dehydrogenase (NAD+) catalytic subunit
MGGVERGVDADDLLRAGARLVAVGTESFRDPRAGARVADELHDLRSNRSESAPEIGSVDQPKTGIR